MKKQTKINYILTLISVFCIGATIPTLIGSSHVNEQHSAKSEDAARKPCFSTTPIAKIILFCFFQRTFPVFYTFC